MGSEPHVRRRGLSDRGIGCARVHVFGTTATGTWALYTHKIITSGKKSINPLELLASAATVLILDRVEKSATYRQIALRGDNTTECSVANT